MPNALTDPFYISSIDPNFVALAQQAVQSMSLNAQAATFPAGFPIPAIPQLFVPPSTIISAPTPAQTPLFDMSLPPENETIEAGSGSLTSSTRTKDERNPSFSQRRSASWETMTDDEREMVQRQKRKEEAYKTALCDAYKRADACPYGESCRFAHGENELRMPSQPRGKAHPKYKTQLCDKFSNYGQCPYGPRCQFIHKLKKGYPLMEYNRLLEQGRISPARDDEITNPEDFEPRHGSFKRFFPSDFDHRDRRDSLDRELYRGGSRVRRSSSSSQHEQEPAEKSKSKERAIYPAMKVINIEKANYVNDRPARREHTARRLSMSPVQSRESSTHRRRTHTTNTHPDEFEENFQPFRALSGSRILNFDSLTQPMSQKAAEAATTPAERRQKKLPELSLIREEPEDTSIAPQLHHSEGKEDVKERAQWFEQIFGKKMAVINEVESDESKDSYHSDVDSATREMSIQSCDEELLAQGRYDHRYPDPPNFDDWKPRSQFGNRH
ncbi:unnamed protein product [Caenorhabditis auriculariae]|uniref:C3H1-type domain-containing protein n=1 Tax=Caenorhabditis auriculariae TaxID=2777116 RepID=A0A8S1H7P5_9PELO|nr:unnamed protein product [Caenorhabditis auriculariae]